MGAAIAAVAAAAAGEAVRTSGGGEGANDALMTTSPNAEAGEGRLLAGEANAGAAACSAVDGRISERRCILSVCVHLRAVF